MELKASKPGYLDTTHYFTPSALRPSETFELKLQRNEGAILRVVSTPRDVEVLLGRTRVGRVTPLEVELRKGAPSETLVLRRDGFITEERIVNASAGMDQSLEITLQQGAVIEVSCAACTGTLWFQNVPRTLPARVTVAPNSRHDLGISLNQGRLVSRAVVSGALGSVTRVSVD